MPGDYSRKIFDPKKHYSGVLMQQGRVQLDADGNEQLDISQHRLHTETNDVIGLCGVPKSDGFKISTAAGGDDLQISPGRIYVGGLMCELEEPGTTYLTQPYYPNPAHTTLTPPLEFTPEQGLYLAFIDAWQREITALDDARIREVALGGPDTTARLQTVWQVRLLKYNADNPPPDPPCEQPLGAFDELVNRAKGLMKARTKPPDNQIDLCLLPATAGYQRMENQLYRVQIHTGGDLNTATFMWSRDNATVESTIENINDNVVTVADLGKDDFLGFAADQWVEIVDEESELNFATRQLVQINTVNPNTRELTMKTSVAALTGLKNAKLRRWDQKEPVANSGGIKINLAEWIDLEGGVQVNFSAGNYQAGDFWLIPARTATGAIEWPVEGPNASPVAQPPVGIQHHYCRIAQIAVNPDGALDVRKDCRPLFPPLTKLTQLHYVSGDGQEGKPGEVLSFPLQVGVANGTFPVEGARVRFEIITSGNGILTGGGTTGQNIIVRTLLDGVAECLWQLDATTKLQRVEATLVDYTSLPVRFNATFQQVESRDGIHIREVNLQTRELRNDRDVSPSELAGGIEIVCDHIINPASIVRPTCFVTLEIPFPFNNLDRDLFKDAVVGFQSLILSADLGVRADTITWIPTPDAAAFLDRLMLMMAELKRGDRVLAHFTLKGNFIWAADNVNLYLDGEAFGIHRTTGPGGIDIPGTGRGPGVTISPGPIPLPGSTPTIDILLPNAGDGRAGGDFEMWFWLKASANTPNLPNITVSPNRLDFAIVTGGTLTPQTVTVGNTGNNTLQVSSAASDNQSVFTIISGGGPFSVPQGNTHPLTVRCNPSAPGPSNGLLTIISNDPNRGTLRIPMTVSGRPRRGPLICVRPSSIDFGPVSFNPRQTATFELIVCNDGDEDLMVDGFRVTNTVFGVQRRPGFIVRAGGEEIVIVLFSPIQDGLVEDTLTIINSDLNNVTLPAITVDLSGFGAKGVIG